MKKLTPNLRQLLTLLSDGNFHSGEHLGKELAVTRSAVWKFINQLQEYGIAVTSTKGKGYRLSQPLVLLDADAIKQHMPATAIAKLAELEIFDSITSTNDHLKNKSTLPTDQLNVCLAEQQTAGRGRFGRQWISPFGVNIYLSCLWHFPKDISALAGLSLVIGLAVIKTLTTIHTELISPATRQKNFITQELVDDLKIKWPNDIVWRGKKLAGILIEINAETHNRSQTIIGIGVNVNMSKTGDSNIDQPWIALCDLDEKLVTYQDRNKIIGLLLNELLNHLQTFAQQGLAGFLSSWQQHDFLFDQPVSLVMGTETISGIAAGINAQGHLLVKFADGSLQAFSSGDVSVKKLRDAP